MRKRRDLKRSEIEMRRCCEFNHTRDSIGAFYAWFRFPNCIVTGLAFGAMIRKRRHSGVSVLRERSMIDPPGIENTLSFIFRFGFAQTHSDLFFGALITKSWINWRKLDIARAKIFHRRNGLKIVVIIIIIRKRRRVFYKATRSMTIFFIITFFHVSYITTNFHRNGWS